MTTTEKIICWLLEGDISIQYQTYRDLLGIDKPELNKRIGTEGWGAGFLQELKPGTYSDNSFYVPKWTSAHYTLLDIKNLNLGRENAKAKEAINDILKKWKASDGGINPAVTIKQSDVCMNGMVLNYASYFLSEEALLKSIIDFILGNRRMMADITAGLTEKALCTALCIQPFRCWKAF